MSKMPQKYGAPYWQVYRPDYHTALLNAALKRGIEVKKGCLVTEYRPEEGSVVLENGEVIKGDLIVAADGVKSLARQYLAKSVEPHETGDTCFRVVVPREKLLADPELAPLVRTPGFEQFLGPDHHIIGYVPFPYNKTLAILRVGIAITCKRRNSSICSWSFQMTGR